MVYSAQLHLERPETSMAFIVLQALHHFPQTYYNTDFSSISSFEKLRQAEILKQLALRYVIEIFPALNTVYGSSTFPWGK